MDELDSLKEEIEILTKRVNILEKKENIRKAHTYFKIIIKILLICLIVFGIWKSYDYVVNGIPDLIEDKVKSINSLKKN